MEIVNDSLPFNILDNKNPQQYKRLINFFSEEIIIGLEKQVALYNIDEIWANYLAHVAYLQDGVKLSVMRRKDPLLEFKIETANIFQTLQQEIENRILKDFESLNLSELGLIALKQRVKPPSSTWTYLVVDNSLMDQLSSLFIGNVISNTSIFKGIQIDSLILSLLKICSL